MTNETTICDNPRGYKYARKICSCRGCHLAIRRERKRIRYRKELNKTESYIGLRDVRHLMRRLKKRGISTQMMADYTSYSWSQMQKIYKTPPKGGPKKVRQSLLTKLKQYELETRGTTPPRGRARSDLNNVDLASAALRALAYQGYPQTWIHTELQKMFGETISIDHLSHICAQKIPMVEKKTEAMLVELVKSVGNKTGPNKATATRARQRGYLSAANYDELI